MGCSGIMEPDDEKKKKLNDDVVVFMRKRSETEAPRYTARLKTYVDFHQKRRRAAAARRHSEHGYHHHEKKASTSASRKKGEGEQKDKTLENTMGSGMLALASLNDPYASFSSRENNTPNAGPAKRRSNCGMSGEHPGGDEDRMSRRSRSGEPSDGCCRRKKKRRRRSCGRKRKRRRKSCGRRRKKRRSCSRRRRRKSCKRRRKKCRRKRKRC